MVFRRKSTVKPKATPRRKQQYKPRRRRIARMPYRVALPNNMKFKLHFTQTQTFNTTGVGSAPNYILFYPNSIYDCVAQSGNQQPYLRDQLYTLYNHCRVIGWSIYLKIIAVNPSYPIECVLAPARDNTADTNIDLAKTRKYAKSCIAINGQTKYMKLNMYVDQYFGQRKGTVMYSADHIQANGIDLSFTFKTPVQFLGYDTSQTLTTNTVMLTLQYHINMYCRFENQIDQTAS